MNAEINIRDYGYDLPTDRIAIHPLPERDQSKLLVYDRGKVLHENFTDLAQYLSSSTTLFFNNTRVIQARLLFEKDSGAVIEVFLLNPVAPSSLLLSVMQTDISCQWKCTIGNLKRWKDGTILTTKHGDQTLEARLLIREEGLVEFRWSGGVTFAEIIDRFGETPLPPYLRREPDEEDKSRYQTVYSRHEGAVAAPTAGLHFTPRVLDSLAKRGVTRQFLTLHVSAGTFQPVKVENAAEHTMHREQIVINRENIDALLRGSTIIAVGTTSMRTLESMYWYGVKLQEEPEAPFLIAQQDAYTLRGDLSLKESMENICARMDRERRESLTGETAIYIMPGYKFRVCQGLITNFHQPGSTLILLVAAFVGDDWRKIYQEALKNDYRFLSYGDSSLLLPG
jgi:S-adenosylmethionine:tRNA ribosyltransferase-isomerase